jgi:hypothetical protein
VLPRIGDVVAEASQPLEGIHRLSTTRSLKIIGPTGEGTVGSSRTRPHYRRRPAQVTSPPTF